MGVVLMENSKAKAIFKRKFGNQSNFMTPNIIGYGMATANLAWELSSGSNMDGGTFYGVTVLEQIWGKPTNRRTDLGQSFATESMARKYIKQLGKGI